MKNFAKVSVFALFVAVMTVACNNAPKTEEGTSSTSTEATSTTTTDTAKAATSTATPDTTKK